MLDKPKTITILGSTGSIGTQTLEVIESVSDKFRIGYLTINSKIELLEEQLSRFTPKGVVIGNEDAYKKFKETTNFKGEILYGAEGIIQAASDKENDLVLTALVGFSGVMPTIAAIENGVCVALANKETLVSAGQIIKNSAEKNNVDIIAVDSEHSAILQCIVGERNDEIEKIILTASGGPFLETPLHEFEDLTVSQALAHPNWSMGDKITIDSATMMNKGFEIIEASWLFDIDTKHIDVLIHPQSIIHSLVQFIDGSVKAQLGLPDMRIPISYALSYPRRLEYDFPRLDLSELTSLHFQKPDFQRVPCLKLAFDALEMGGAATAVLNSANEVAVQSFLEEKIKFTRIPQCIESALNKIPNNNNPSLNEIIEIDKETRDYTLNFVNSLS